MEPPHGSGSGVGAMLTLSRRLRALSCTQAAGWVWWADSAPLVLALAALGRTQEW